jgi:hypothetical protein
VAVVIDQLPIRSRGKPRCAHRHKSTAEVP